MCGRITSKESAVNRYGVPYKRLLALEQEQHAHLLAVYRAALDAWLHADAQAANSRARRSALTKARQLTKRAIN